MYTTKLPGREAAYTDTPDRLNPRLKEYLHTQKISIYTHQAETYEALAAGWDCILATKTASGKTLAFALPIFDRLMCDPDATALLLYPTKALARDQLATFREIDAAIGAGTRPAVYDGDTPRSARPGIRASSRIIISNMHEIHHILPWRKQWADFFGELSFIVIDEAHRYRGVFGSHIAQLIRRLRRVLAFYDADPAFILATATLGNPEEFGSALIGRSCRLISNDGSPQNGRTILFYNPYARDPAASLIQETADLFALSLGEGHQTICFSPSRRLAEVIALRARDGYAHDPRLRADILAYRAGYLPEERREIEVAMKSGRLRGIVTTNALELGIDIGTLDTVVMAGYPGTTLSFWQQAGRAGRSGSDSLVAMVARYDPIDQYYMHHPDRFFNTAYEHAAIDLENPIALSGHLLCAAAELPVSNGDSSYFGPHTADYLASLADEGLIARTGKGYVYAGPARATELVSLTGSGSGGYRITLNGRLIETMDESQAYREAYPGAILLHQGESYIVRSVDRRDHQIRVEQTDLDYHTRPLMRKDVSVDRIIKSASHAGIQLLFAGVTVTEDLYGFRIVRYDRVIGSSEVDAPPLSFPTQGLLIGVDEEMLAGYGITNPDGALHAAEHALIAAMPGVVLCDRYDIGGLSTSSHPAAAGPAVIIYDGYLGGAGLAAKAYDLIGSIIALAGEIVTECRCIDGCPACIFSPKCGNDNQPLDKEGAKVLLRLLLLILQQPCSPPS
nr:DEAD/DEAH box helicase [Methanocalculus sp. AMF5]